MSFLCNEHILEPEIPNPTILIASGAEDRKAVLEKIELSCASAVLSKFKD